MQENNKQTVFVAGLGATGSSAIIDYLKEYKNNFVFEDEFRLFVDPGGLINLRNALVEDWSIFQTDGAIRNYKRLVKNINKRYFGSYSTLGHSKYLDKVLLQYTDSYIKELTSCVYKGLWYGIDNIVKRQLNKYAFFHRNKIISDNIYVGKQLSSEEFESITNTYINKLEDYCLNKYNASCFIFNENFSCMFPRKILKMVNNSKMIVVIRDPRDVFATTIGERWGAAPGEPYKFIEWEKLIFDRWVNIYNDLVSEDQMKDILVIKFEDLVIRYDVTTSKIRDFLGLSIDDHVYKHQFFDPNVSCKNVQLYEKLISNEVSNSIRNQFDSFYKTFEYNDS